MSTCTTARQINGRINARVDYVPDQVQYGTPEHWAAAVKAGDCEDYALAKFDALLADGVPREAMRLAVVFTETAEGQARLALSNQGVDTMGDHAVLFMTDDDGNDWLLDNRHEDVVRGLEGTGYALDRIWNYKLNAWEAA